MIGFIVAVAAGYLTPQFQSSVAPPVAQALKPLSILESEYDVIGLMAAFLAAALVSTVLSSGSTLGIAIGVAIGYFGTRLVKIVQDATSGRPRD